jgi:hypothetical protein
MRAGLIGAVVLAAWLASPSTASAQTDRQADKWRPWLGCWSLVTENVREGTGTSLGSAFVPGGDPSVPADSTPRTCVARSGDGVTMTTTVPGQQPITQTIVADGSPHDIADGECRGVERTQWSNNGTRLFAHADVKCDAQAPRVLTGFGLITRDGNWLDIRSFQIDGRDATRVTRYRRITGTRISGLPLSIDEIKEASRSVASSVVEAAVAESRPTFSMNKRLVLDLADANVPPNVIDVMIAVSYPDRFVIEKPIQNAMAAAPGPDLTDAAPPFDPFWPNYYYPAYYYSPFAYGYLGRYDPYYYGAVGYYPIGGYPVGGGGGGVGSGPGTPSGSGRAINGQGYTRIVPASAEPHTPRQASGDGSQAIVSRSSGGSTASANSSPSSPPPAPAPAPAPSDSGGGGGGGGATASPQGFSGGGGDGGGRTAVPR